MQSNWDKFRFILAVAEHGSLSGAARELSVSHATVLRKIKDAEEELSCTLFIKSLAGYTLTETGHAAIADLKAMETLAQEAQRKLTGTKDQLHGSLRITLPIALTRSPLMDCLANFTNMYPNLTLDLSANDSEHDLDKNQADVAIRFSNTPPDHLIGFCLGNVNSAVYGRVDNSDIGNTKWVGWNNSSLNDEDPDDADYQALTDSGLLKVAAVETGLGLGRLPIFLAKNSPHLVQLFEFPELPVRDLWVLYHADLKGVARIAILTKHLRNYLDIASWNKP